MVGTERARASAAALVAATWLGGGTANAASGVQGLEVLSNRADLISGGDALVAARLAGGADPATLRVDLDGVDVTGAFALRPSGRFEGLVTGLKVGSEHADRARRGRSGQADHDHQPPDRRPGVRRPAGDAVRVQSERVEPAARRGRRRAVQRADAGSTTSTATRPTSSWPTTRPTRPRPRSSSRRRPTAG